MSSWSVLMVCEGNLARSPLASALLEQAWPEDRWGPAKVGSAGTRAAEGEWATEQMRTVATSLGLDLEQHRSRRLTCELVRESDLVLGMTEQQREAAQRLLPSATARIFTLVELVRLLGESSGDCPDLGAVVASAHASRPYTAGPGEPEDIEDPYGLGDDVYRQVAGDLTGLVGALTDLLAGQTPDRVPRGR